VEVGASDPIVCWHFDIFPILHTLLFAFLISENLEEKIRTHFSPSSVHWSLHRPFWRKKRLNWNFYGDI